MKNKLYSVLFIILALSLFLFTGCANNSTDAKDSETVSKQQEIYGDVQPVHIYDYSVPRDIYQQIYDMTTTQVIATYSVIETITGVTKYECPSMGYAIPADRSLTNPLKGTNNIDTLGADEFSVVVEQFEPDGLISSKNTDGTWVMCVDTECGEVYPVYTEHKVTTFPFIMEKDENDQWQRADNKPSAFKISIEKGKKNGKKPPRVR